MHTTKAMRDQDPTVSRPPGNHEIIAKASRAALEACTYTLLAWTLNCQGPATEGGDWTLTLRADYVENARRNLRDAGLVA